MKSNKIAIKAAALLIAMILIAMPVFAEDGGQSESTKNETVYGMLYSDGSVDKVFVVNQLLGEYKDYGEYTEIQNLSTISIPTIEGDKIIFPDENIDGGLFYQGTIDAELPMLFNVKYYLDGEVIDSESLAGASGNLSIHIIYAVNDKCPERVRDGLTTQISVTLNMEKASSIVAEDAATFVAGNTMTINYTLFPGSEGTAVLDAYVEDFEMNPITINMMKSSFGGEIEEGIKDFQTGFDDMFDGANELVDGTTELQDGMVSLVSGVRSLYHGMKDLKSAANTIETGMQSYKDGLSQYLNGISSLSSGSAGIQTGLDTLATEGAALSGGLSQVNDGLSLLSSSTGDLKVLAESLSSSPDPNVQALASGTLQTLNSIDSLVGGLSASNTGMSQYVAGVEQFATEYGTFDAGISGIAGGTDDLISGYNDMFDGVKSFNDGVIKSIDGVGSLYYSIKELPDDVQKLVDGQIEFKDGIGEAREEIDEEASVLVYNDLPAVSFASPDKNHPASVQYIIMIKGIEKPSIEIIHVAEEENENFFTRLLALFR